MDWPKLKQALCPVPGCKGNIKDVGGIMRCDHCRFVMELERFRSVLVHRANEEKPATRIYWQNIKSDHCPLDNHPLNEYRDKNGLRHCSNRRCRFRIRQGTIDEILADPGHPAHRYDPIV